MPVKLRSTLVDCLCKCLGGLSVGSGFHGVHYVPAAGASVTGVICVVDLAVSVDVVGATSLVMDATGLMSSG